MKQRFCLVLAALVIVLSALTIVTAQPKGKPKPLVAVMPFKVDSPNKVFVDKAPASVRTLWAKELKKRGKVRVLSLKQTDARLKAQSLVWEYNLESVKAKEFGKALGVKYLLTGMVTIPVDLLGVSSAKSRERTYSVTMNTSLIDTNTGEIVWAVEASAEESGPVVMDDEKSRALAAQRFKALLESCVQKLSAKFTAATLPGLLE